MEKQQHAHSTQLKSIFDLKNYEQKELGLTEWKMMTQEQINLFADATDDHQWIHLDEKKSAQFSPYKKTVAHGFLMVSLASKMSYETLQMEDVGMGVNYGLDKVRFPNATLSGTFYRGRVSLLSFEEIPLGIKYKLGITIELKGQEKPACVAEFIAIAYKAPDGVKKHEEKLETPSKRDSEAVLYKKEEGIGVITLNRPNRYNAVNDDLLIRLNEILGEIRDDSQVRAVVLTGEGKGFCAGADMDNFGTVTPERGKEYINTTYQTLFRNLFTLRKPIIGAINGTAAGVGASIALACDLRVMTSTSGLMYAFINIGLGPDGGASWLLTRQVGYSKAFEIAAEGKKIKAEECLKLGLTNKVVEDGELLASAKEWALKLSQKPTTALGITKEDLMYSMENSIYDTVAYEAEKQVDAFKSYDHNEGVSAFVEKREPHFLGK